MMNEKKNKSLSEQIADTKKYILSTNDHHLQGKLIDKLLSLKAQQLTEPMEICVPTREVKESIDFGPCKVSRTIRGYIFEAKGGLTTVVDLRMVRLCAAFNTLFEMHRNKNMTSEKQEIYDSFSNALQYVYQSPIFASLSEEMLFGVAADLLRQLNSYNESIEAKELNHETEQDVRDNMDMELASEAIESIADAPLPSKL